MPELPEVETIRHDLQKKIIGKTIADVLVLDKRSVSVPKRTAPDKTIKSDLSEFKKALIKNKFVKIERRGKLLIFELESGKYLLTHLKMTGQLIYEERGKRKGESGRVVAGGHSFKKAQSFNLPDKFTKIIFEFSDPSSPSGLRRVNGSKLFFNDMRVFGYMRIVDVREKERIEKEDFGWEPLVEFSKLAKLAEFAKLFENKKTRIKALLMDQKKIAGIGNIYADEICFCAGVKPDRRADKLSEAEIKKLFACIPKVLKLAIKHRGTTFNNYVDSDGNKGNFTQFLKVYGRGGLKCKRCEGIIKKIKQGGRGTHFCADCQK